MTENIRKFFDNQAILTDDEWAFFSSKLIKKNYKKGEIILNEGEIEHYLSFNTKGIVRMFHVKPDGTEISVSFIFENDFISSYGSFVTQSPSTVYVQCLQDCELYCISKTDLEMAYSISQTGERLGRINSEFYSYYLFERNLSLLTLNAEQRYLQLLKRSPKVAKFIPLKYISSYLGITPESLSRIRKHIV